MNGSGTVNPQTHITGDVYGPVLSGIFYGPVSVFSASQYADLRRKLIDIAPILTRVRVDRFVGREFVSTALDHFLTANPRGYFRLISQPGVGKTAFLAHLVQQRGYLHHFIDRSQGITSLAAGLENLSAQVIVVSGLDWGKVGLPPEAGRDGAFLAARLNEAALALPAEKKLVLVVDALDEAERPLTGNALCLPSALPDNVYFVVAHRPDHVRLETAPGTPVCSFTLSADGDANLVDMGIYLDGQLARPEIAISLTKAKPPMPKPEFKKTLIKHSAGNFMYLDFVLEDIATSSTLSLDALPEGLEGYYEHFWDQLREARREDRDLWKTVHRPVIQLLAVVQEPVSIDWLVHFGNVEEEDIREDILTKWRHLLAEKQQDEQISYRLFHQSFQDFLNRKLGRQELAHIHRDVADAYLTSADDEWKSCEMYGLRHLLSHLLVAAQEGRSEDADWARGQLSNILKTDSFVEASLAQLDRPQELLGSIRSAVTVLLEACDLERAWIATRRYQHVLQQQRQTEQVFGALHTQRFDDALQRTLFYGERPGFQALLQLLVAWYANRAGEEAIGQRAAQAALDHAGNLFDRDEKPDIRYTLEANWRKLLAEALFRAAHAAGPFWLNGLSMKEGFGEQVYAQASARSNHTAQSQESGLASGSTIETLLNKLEAKLREDHPTTYREAAMLYRKELAQELSKTWHDFRWYEYVDRSVTLIALDDYPSYRELALVVIALPIAQHPSDDRAMIGLETLLKAALESAEPHFTQDLPIALLQLQPGKFSSSKGATGLADSLTYTTASGMAEEPAPYTGVWGGTIRSDPWAREVLRYSAVAAVQRRLGEDDESRNMLKRAAKLDHRPNYAGYRALAHLALACRWVEFGDTDAALEQVAEASLVASFMQEEALGNERQALAQQIAHWIEKPVPSPDEAWQQLNELGETEKAWYIRLLSAQWMGDIHQLRKLVPLALGNPTVLDAVLGRIVGTLASTGAYLSALEALSKEVEIAKNR
jgi:hypothetical protein